MNFINLVILTHYLRNCSNNRNNILMRISLNRDFYLTLCAE